MTDLYKSDVDYDKSNVSCDESSVHSQIDINKSASWNSEKV